MRDAVIVEAVRTPIGRRNGGLAEVHPVELSATVLGALLDRVGIEAGTVDDVVWGCVGQVGEQAGNIARNAVLAAGWPESVPGTTIERQCGSSQQALHFAAAGVISGQYDRGRRRRRVDDPVPMGSARRVGLGDPNSDAIRRRYEGIEFNQGRGADFLAARYELSRGWLDEYSLRSHQRAAQAADDGSFDGEIVPGRPRRTGRRSPRTKASAGSRHSTSSAD